MVLPARRSTGPSSTTSARFFAGISAMTFAFSMVAPLPVFLRIYFSQTTLDRIHYLDRGEWFDDKTIGAGFLRFLNIRNRRRGGDHDDFHIRHGPADFRSCL